jgi:hypothetical protein
VHHGSAAISPALLTLLPACLEHRQHGLQALQLTAANLLVCSCCPLLALRPLASVLWPPGGLCRQQPQQGPGHAVWRTLTTHPSTAVKARNAGRLSTARGSLCIQHDDSRELHGTTTAGLPLPLLLVCRHHQAHS